MKLDRYGQGKVLSPTELRQLFSVGFDLPRDKALFAICLFTACRISEALQLEKTAILEDTIILKKNTTKGKIATREIAISLELRPFLEAYEPAKPLSPYYFPGYKEHLKKQQAHKILVKACRKCGIVGASTHSFRRTALTKMHSEGVPLGVIQSISGHRSLSALQSYLEVSDEEKIKAISLLGFQEV